MTMITDAERMEAQQRFVDYKALLNAKKRRRQITVNRYGRLVRKLAEWDSELQRKCEVTSE